MPYDYLIPIVLFFIVLPGCIYHLAKYLPRGSVILLIVGIAFVPKFGALTSPYYGTEYEDAFVFQADSKSLTEHMSKADPFRIQIAEYNVQEGKDYLMTYSGHFTSYSALIWLCNKTFGYSRFSAIWLNLFLSGLLFLVLYLTVFAGSNSKEIALVSILLLASSPVINLFQTSGLAETYSSFIVATFIYFAIRFWKNEKLSHPDLLFLITSLMLCLLIKRENMVLLSVFPFISYKLIANKSFWWVSLSSVALFLYFIFVSPFSTEFLEASDIQTSTFSFSYLLVQLPTYVSAFFKPQLYGFAFWVFCILVILIIYKRSLPRLENAAVLGVFLGFLTIYCLHYRSRYFVLSMEMSDFETFRYANNFYYLIPLFVGLNLKALGSTLEHRMKYLIGILAIAFCFSAYSGQKMRQELHLEEYQTRILPLLTANKLINDLGNEAESVLVTDIPLVGKMLEANEFGHFVSQFQEGRDYSEFKGNNQLFFLVPKELVTEQLSFNNSINAIPLNIDTNYTFFQLH